MCWTFLRSLIGLIIEWISFLSSRKERESTFRQIRIYIGNVDLIVAGINLIERIDSHRLWKNVRRREESLTNNRRRPWKNASADAGRGWWSAGTCGRTAARQKGKSRRVLIDDVRRMRRLSTSARALRCRN